MNNNLPFDNQQEAPSPVLHIRPVPLEATENDLIQCIAQYSFGTPINAVRIMQKFQQALVEMDSIDTASRVIKFSQDTPPLLLGKPIQISFSRSKSINSQVPIGNVLLVTIENAILNINVDILHHFFCFYGEVLRIVIFTKNELQALVEFSNPESAFNAKKHLNNVPLYQGGACLLKIEISKTEHLNVTKNTDRTKDYTKTLPVGMPYFQPSVTPPQRTSVIIVYGLDDLVTCDRLFNLFSLYGNVQKIKMLPNKKGAAMVQMEDAQQADAIIKYYNQAILFGQQLLIQYSKHLSIADSHNQEAQSQSRDYTHSQLNRFSHPINTYKHIYKPSQTLYFSNVPKEYTELAFHQLFTSMNTHKPIGVKIFPSQPATPPGTKPGDTKIVGLLEFSSSSHALEALLIANNAQIPGSHSTIRLSFSNSTVLPQPPRSASSSSSTSTVNNGSKSVVLN
ncbi:hypothetical protein SAMD00019534_094510 [Acytostelium subglobosum LB1]|uniref:hypothetical protein n=1 Tax=Acytostelium subglobosum LB1 TaxID=1410327 RepID=UPI000644F8B5|nr:hypothetical protein SAMD00019534_094510 [Acytostelium subglobosum LB1]GAM26276.1 hypothetical protein SAMD00019534_094510 [Acytostelium subglobosum LB1]|eukprot:XP_012750830.1 hypothetical protein SAMD00019534_094510 [Acytostelium subglobosum LB1]